MPQKDVFEKTPLLKCVKHVLDFYFGNIGYDTINAFLIHGHIFDIKNAQQIFESFNLEAVDKTISAGSMPKHFLPAIVFDPSGNPLVLTGRSGDKFTVYDPSDEKEHTMGSGELKTYKKALLVLRDMKYIKYIDGSEKRSWFYEPLKLHWRSYIEIGVLTLFINIFALAIPLFIMNVYNRVVPNQAFETLFVLAGGTIIILIFDVILKYARSHILEKISKRVGLFWEEELMSKMMLVDMEFDRYMSGSKANLFKELQYLREFFTNKTLLQVIDFPFFILAIAVIYIISPAIALIPFIFALLMIGFNLFMQRPISKLNKNSSENTQSKYSFIFESVQGAQSVKLGNAVPARMFLWRNIIAFVDGIGMKIQSLHMLSMNITQFFLQLVSVLVVILGVFQITEQNLSIGGLIAVTMLSSRAMVPIVGLSAMLVRLKEIGESVERIDEFISLPTEHTDTAQAGLGKINGKIEFKDVTYKFQNTKTPSLQNISFSINPGEKVGIIGHTGAGKSTLLKLLIGLYRPTNGSIYLDDHDITTVHPVEIRQNIGVMPQEPFLFDATIKENIELFRPIDKTKMAEIITFTGLGDFIKKSGKGDALQVGERGCNLSVGQRHLVVLARALLGEPSILVLDEPTTGLDIGSEKRLIERLKSGLKTETTLLVITHRLAALELVDRIIVVNDGKIVADGPRDKVLQALHTPVKKGKI